MALLCEYSYLYFEDKIWKPGQQTKLPWKPEPFNSSCSLVILWLGCPASFPPRAGIQFHGLPSTEARSLLLSQVHPCVSSTSTSYSSSPPLGSQQGAQVSPLPGWSSPVDLADLVLLSETDKRNSELTPSGS